MSRERTLSCNEKGMAVYFRAGLLKRCPAEQRRLTWLAASVKTSESEPEMWRHFHTALDPPHRNECDKLLIDFARTFSKTDNLGRMLG